MQFGTPTLTNSADAKCIRIVISSDAIDLSWHHCGTTSDFISEFFSKACDSDIDANDAHHSINYLINEILENAIKFRYTDDIVITGSLEMNSFEICITNTVNSDTAERFQEVLSELLSRDPGELLLEKIEQNAMDMSSGGSGLGLLTLMNDYDARLGWAFDKVPEQSQVRLATVAALTLS
ncbi:ATP-binding protein [Roseibium polysiphoniae]|uniref:ATP-binding protein n=1 Tax=Roseibium polysiphoniae TaxID=2571221 RepID=A0A944CFX1_9HYPH|nr:DUF6272 family protein [Roseibium polysiphoniae]MBS8262586.1 ATP-binding protein [Roseibium polysiphoniae]